MQSSQHKPGVCQKDLQKQSLRPGKASVYQRKILQCCCCILLAREEAGRGDRLESAHLNWVLKHRGSKSLKTGSKFLQAICFAGALLWKPHSRSFRNQNNISQNALRVCIPANQLLHCGGSIPRNHQQWQQRLGWEEVECCKKKKKIRKGLTGLTGR